MAIPIIWGLGTLGAYGLAFRRRYRSWRIHHDGRSKRDVLVFGALFLAAIASCASIFAIAFAIDGPPLRRVLAGIAWGAFFAAGLLALMESPREDPGPTG